MNLEDKIMHDIKNAMLNKDSLKLDVCSAIKSAILLAKTEKGSQVLTDVKEMEILQKLYKQRQESCQIYLTQKRKDLADQEQEQAKIIKEYLPNPYSQEELEEIIDNEIKTIPVEGFKPNE